MMARSSACRLPKSILEVGVWRDLESRVRLQRAKVSLDRPAMARSREAIFPRASSMRTVGSALAPDRKTVRLALAASRHGYGVRLRHGWRHAPALQLAVRRERRPYLAASHRHTGPAQKQVAFGKTE